MRSDRWGALKVAGTGSLCWHPAEDLLRRGHDLVFDERKVRIFDYRVRRAVPRSVARQRRAAGGRGGLEIEFVRKRNFRKEDRGEGSPGRRGEHPGLVCVLSPWSPARPINPGKQAAGRPDST